MTNDEILNRFTYHKASPEGTVKHHELSRLFVELASQVDLLCPDGREKSLTFTALQEAKMWASAAVACNPKTC